MQTRLPALLFAVVFAFPALSQEVKTAALDTIEVTATPLGDVPEGVATRLTFRYSIPQSRMAQELALHVTVMHAERVVKTLRYVIVGEEQKLESVEVLPAGALVIESKLVATMPDGSPAIAGRNQVNVKIAPVGTAYEPGENASAKEIVAVGVPGEAEGSVRILPPKRDLAPNLFIVDVEVKSPVTKVEFYVEEKKIFSKNAPPYRAELDLGKLPNRVTVRVVGYDKRGNYIDADAWIVNERENQLELKITRTVTKDGSSRVKVSVQNPGGLNLSDVELYADDTRIARWSKPPYSITLQPSQLSGVRFIRASVKSDTNIEASDLVFLDGSRFTDAIEVNVVELPVSVVDETGAPIADLKQEDFSILEDGKPQKMTGFAFASNLPLSLGVLVDHSGSMKPRIERARTAAMKFVTQMVTAKDRAYYGGFSWEATKISPLVSDVESLKTQITNMPEPEGATALYDAIISGLYQFRGVEGRKALVIVTDGEDTASRVDYDEMLLYLRSARIPVYFIGISLGPLGGGGRLKSLAAESGGVAYFVRKVDELDAIYAEIGRQLRTQYILSYRTESSGKDDHRYRTIEVKTNRPKATVRTIRGFVP